MTRSVTSDTQIIMKIAPGTSKGRKNGFSKFQVKTFNISHIALVNMQNSRFSMVKLDRNVLKLDGRGLIKWAWTWTWSQIMGVVMGVVGVVKILSCQNVRGAEFKNQSSPNYRLQIGQNLNVHHFEAHEALEAQ